MGQTFSQVDSQRRPAAPIDQRPHPYPAPATTDQELSFYTDGSMLMTGNWGGCGLARYKDGQWESTSEAMGTIASSNDAEMCGVFLALKIAVSEHEEKVNCKKIIVYTDSWFCITLMKGGGKAEARLVDLFVKAEAQHNLLASLGVTVEYVWIKGHAGDPGNVVADQLAGLGSRRSEQGLVGVQQHTNLGKQPPFTTEERAANEVQRLLLKSKISSLKKAQRQQQRRAESEATQPANTVAGRVEKLRIAHKEKDQKKLERKRRAAFALVAREAREASDQLLGELQQSLP